MSDLKVGEAFKDKVYITTTATGAAKAGLATVTCTVIDESGNRAAGVVAEESDGWYTCSFTPDATGTWSTEWDSGDASLYTVYFAPKIFKVGGGTIADIYSKVDTEVGSLQTAVNTVATYHDKPAQNSADNAYIRDVVGNKTDTTAGNSIVALEKINAAAIAVIDEFHDVPAQNAAANAQMNEVIGNKTDTTAGDSVVSLIKIETAALAVVDEYHDVPAQNAVANSQMNEVIGNKTDTTAGNSIIALLKQIVEDTGTTLDDLVDGLEARLSNHLVTRTWFSDSQEEVALTNGAGDKTLPSVVLPNITGTIVHAYAGFKFRMIENTNAAANKLNGAQDIQVKENAAGAFTDAINFVDDQFGIAALTREGGDCIIGDIDLVAQVAAFNKTYAFQWDEGVADQSNLQFNDVQTFLIVSYY